MKTTINNKRYDSNKCERLGKIISYNNGNQTGVLYLLRARDGMLIAYNDTNGQDGYNRDYMCAWDDTQVSYDALYLDDDQEQRMAELGLITIVE